MYFFGKGEPRHVAAARKAYKRTQNKIERTGVMNQVFDHTSTEPHEMLLSIKEATLEAKKLYQITDIKRFMHEMNNTWIIPFIDYGVYEYWLNIYKCDMWNIMNWDLYLNLYEFFIQFFHERKNNDAIGWLFESISRSHTWQIMVMFQYGRTVRDKIISITKSYSVR
jgi:hypothetical protein